MFLTNLWKYIEHGSRCALDVVAVVFVGVVEVVTVGPLVLWRLTLILFILTYKLLLTAENGH